MPRVERFTAQGEIPVQQAQLIDPGGFPADTSSAEALRVAGETATDFGLRLERERKVKEELAKRKRAAQDRIGITDANAIMDNAEREYAKRIIGKPLTEHELIRIDEINKARAKVTQLNLSPDAREIADSNTDIKADKFSDIAELANIQATNKDALIKTSEAYETSLIEGDIGAIAEAEVMLDEQLKNMPPAEAAKFKDELEERATKEIERNALAAQIDRAALTPEQATNPDGTGYIDEELESRRKGKNPSPEFALLSNADLEAVRDYAKSVGEKKKSDSASAADAVVRASYKQIINGDVNITDHAKLILSDPTISDEDKIVAVNKIKTFFTTWNSAVKDSDEEEIITSDSTRIKVLRSINAVKTGSMTVEEGLEVYTTISKIEGVNGTDGKGFINDIFAAGETAKRVESVRQNEILGEREKQLRDAIEKQPNFFGDDVAAEILKDFANKAVIELNDAFREGEFDKKELDAQVDNLIRRYTLSEVQQLNAANARSLRLANTLKEQQESITKLMTSLREQGKAAEAQRIMDEAIELGIFTKEGETIKKGTGKKKNIGIEVIKRMLDSIIR